jgi:glycosyltransferase involved in cell wall biosynthesis
MSIRSQVISLKKKGVMAEIIALCDKKKWESSRHLEVKSSHGTRVLIWPCYPLGLIQPMSSRILNAHLIPANGTTLNEHLNQFDLLHFHDVVDLSFPLSCLRSRKPKIFTCHTLYESTEFYQHSHIARKLLLRSADLFHVFSKADARTMLAFGVDKNHIRVVPHGIDVRQFRPRIHSIISRDAVHIVLVGRIERRKGVAELLKAVNIMKQPYRRNEKIVVSVVGDVWDPSYYRELLEYKKQMQLDEVNFVGFVDDLPNYLSQADILVCPSLSETFGIVNLEAMASGLPIVATSVGAIPDTLVDGQTGFLVPPGDTEALAERLSRLVADNELRADMGRMGRKRVEALFSMDRIASVMSDIYQELVVSL